MFKSKNKKQITWGGVKNTSILHLSLESDAKRYGTIAEQPGWENYFKYKYGMKWIFGLHPPSIFAKRSNATKTGLIAAALTTPMGPIMASNK